MNASLRLLSLCLPCGLIAIVSAQDPEPDFRTLVESGEYAEALSGYREQIDEAGKLAATDLPTTGTKIGPVVPGSTADRLGIVPGMILTSLNGEPTNWSLRWKDRTGDSEAVFYTADGQEIRHSVPPGLLGVNKYKYFRPELSLIRANKGSQDEAWYPHAVLGALAAETNPALAETAWSMAMKEGYREDVHSDYFAAAFALHRAGRLSPALDRFLARCDTPEGVPLWSQEVIVGLLAAEGRIDDLAKIMSQKEAYRIWSGDDMKRLQSLSSAPPPSITEMDPLAYVNSRPFRFLNSEMEVINEYDAGWKRSGDRPPFSSPMAAITRPPGYFTRTGMRHDSEVKNFHVRLDLARLGVAGHHEKYMELAEVTLVSNSDSPSRLRDGTPPDENVVVRTIIGYVQTASDEVKMPSFTFTASNLPSRWNMSTVPFRKPITMADRRTGFGFENLVIDLFRIEKEIFVYINGTRYLRMPIAEDQGNPGVFFQCIGTSIFFNEFTFREYRP